MFLGEYRGKLPVATAESAPMVPEYQTIIDFNGAR